MNIAVITGASSGIGKEFALQTLNNYHDIDEIWLVARRAHRLEELSGLINCRTKMIVADFASESGLALLSNEIAKVSPDIRLLVNSAGCGRTGEFSKGAYDDEIRMIDLNCRALVAVTHICLPYFAKDGRIINIASVAAFMPQPEFSVYAASKSFVLSFSRSLSRELHSRSIVVTAVCPGPVATEFFDIADPHDQGKKYKKYFTSEAADVVSKAFSDSRRRKEISIFGLSMKFVYVISKLLPHRLILTIIYKKR